MANLSNQLLALRNAPAAVPALIPIEDGAPGFGRLAIVKGYLSMSPSEARENVVWAERLRAAGWKGAIYQLRWESGDTREIIRKIGLSLVLRAGLKLAARRVLLPLPPLGIYELSEIRRHWKAARDRADAANVPALVETLRREAPLPEWTLMGHSLGARIVFNLIAAHDAETERLRSAVLLGATVSHDDERWAPVAERVIGQILNVHHRGDRVLNWLFRATEFNRIEPCGVSPIRIAHRRIQNVDASRWLKSSFRSHMQYHEVLDQAVGPHMWRSPLLARLPEPNDNDKGEST